MPYPEFLLRKRAAAIRKREQLALMRIAVQGTEDTNVSISLADMERVADGR